MMDKNTNESLVKFNNAYYKTLAAEMSLKLKTMVGSTRPTTFFSNNLVLSKGAVATPMFRTTTFSDNKLNALRYVPYFLLKR